MWNGGGKRGDSGIRGTKDNTAAGPANGGWPHSTLRIRIAGPQPASGGRPGAMAGDFTLTGPELAGKGLSRAGRYFKNPPRRTRSRRRENMHEKRSTKTGGVDVDFREYKCGNRPCDLRIRMHFGGSKGWTARPHCGSGPGADESARVVRTIRRCHRHRAESGGVTVVNLPWAYKGGDLRDAGGLCGRSPNPNCHTKEGGDAPTNDAGRARNNYKGKKFPSRKERLG